MRIQYASDLHLEYEEDGFKLDRVGADVLVLAGDIGYGVKGLEWALLHTDVPKIVFVPGNHEYYHADYLETAHKMRLFCLESEGRIHFLPDGPTVIDGVRFLGSTLWTDFEFISEPDRLRALTQAQKSIRDYTVISNGAKPLQPTDTMEMHWKERRAIEGLLAIPFQGETIVVTHHAPTAQAPAIEYRGRDLASAYASRMDGTILKYEPAYWFHGHIHMNSDLQIGQTRILANPRGYTPKRLNPDFSPGAFVDIAPRPELKM